MLSRFVRELDLRTLLPLPFSAFRSAGSPEENQPTFSGDGEARFTVSPALDRLLAVGARPAEYFPSDLSTEMPASTTTAPISTGAPGEYNFNIPAADRIYVHMPVEALLEEYVKVALDFGSPDEPVLARDRIMGNMLFALMLTPARQQDVPRLRQAYYALELFFFDFRFALKTAAAYAPELKPALTAVSAPWAREAVSIAMAVPLGPDGQAQYVHADFKAVLDTVPTPRQLTEAAQAWLEQQALARVRMEARWFFGEQLDLCLRNAFSNQEADLLRFTQGHIVIQPAKIALLTVVRNLPAGRMRPYVDKQGRPRQREYAEYPFTGWRQSLKAIWLELPDGSQITVDVAVHQGRHSFTLNGGQTWHASGVETGPALEALRADFWRELLSQKLLVLDRIRRG
ncbi:hypothetical protein GT347_00765 [Xylophilus rhododendri]|uniref:Uncharacterized protein n=1 Tax=Xylophilus rhododendri TaxID=2697032 RepID=A0A857J0M0_9BURK|nr:hypothetical protein [Xylophilus rhododendri]QHI96651.1 hypothetical protein GT347_00765 [Xylophilus rhododendri]